MPNYRRNRTPGATFFCTVVAYERRPWLCTEPMRQALREAIRLVRSRHPFQIVAWVLLPDHLHCIWRLPPGDADYSGRWRMIKSAVSRRWGAGGDETQPAAFSRAKRRERLIWQRRFWEHTIRDERDLAAHLDYIHYNPVKHRLCSTPAQWPYSSFHRFVREGRYPLDWAAGVAPSVPDSIGGE
ncbi:REP-associated tyrosine transposase [Pelomicrobium sp. G1]|uniref:REP-associated tyrosine transposase n=1 Tax=unclassified Pelomicrobium TaxID=2815318 RepID=UPI003F76213A